jgi:hypothetical protein
VAHHESDLSMSQNALSQINPQDALIAAEAATKGDLSKLSPEQRTQLYAAVCSSMGLNPLSRPFEFITLNSKLTLYATRTATDQLRKINGVSITNVDKEVFDGVLTVTVHATDASGRTDMEIGAVTIAGLKGEALANAHMKALTKAKRRVTLSISGLGWMDESEVSSVPSASMVIVNSDGEILSDNDSGTGEIVRERQPAPRQEQPRGLRQIVAATDRQKNLIRVKGRALKLDAISMDQLCEQVANTNFDALTRQGASDVIERLTAMEQNPDDAIVEAEYTEVDATATQGQMSIADEYETISALHDERGRSR